jgi:PAS domain S-box-containing protein
MAISLPVILLCSLLHIVPSRAATTDSLSMTDTVIVVNSVANADSWLRQLYWEMDKYVREKGSCVLVSELLTPNEMDDEAGYEQALSRIALSHPNPPRLVVFIGNYSWTACRPLLDSVWKDVPAIICEAYHQVPSTLQGFIPGHTPPDSLMSTTRASIDGYNATAIVRPFFISETINAIKELRPEIKQLMLISDQRFESEMVRSELQRVILTSFGTLELINLQYPLITTEELLDTINTASPETGIIYYSWYTAVSGNMFRTNDRVQSIVASLTMQPVFTIADMHVEDGRFAGGHFISNAALIASTMHTVKRILNGERADAIPMAIAGDNYTYLNYRNLVLHGVSEEQMPKSAVYYELPEDGIPIFVYILIIIAVPLFGAIVYLLTIHILRERRRRQDYKLHTRYEQMIGHMPIIYYQILPKYNHQGVIYDSVLLDVNVAFEKFFNVRKSALVNRNTTEVARLCPPFAALARSQKVGEVSIVVADKQGNEVYFDRLTFESADNKTLDVFCIDKTDAHNILQDTSRQQKALETILNHIPIAVKVKDVNERLGYVFWNTTAEQLFESTSEYALGRTDYDTMPEDVAEMIRQEDLELIRTGQTQIATRHFFDHKGEEHFTHQSNSLIHLPSGKDWVLFTAWDVTQMKKLERELRYAKEQAEESNRMKSAFLANMSHEIRTPLNAIVGFSSILANEADEAERKEYLSIIEHNNALLLQLISDILDLAKIEAGTLDFSYTNVDINKTLREIERTSNMKQTRENIPIIAELPMQELYLYTDQTRFTQVVTNFINNAMKFTYEGDIRFGYHKPKDNTIYFYVTDTGTGIPADKKDSIFNRFVKLDSFEKGTGLGLSICKNIVAEFKGTIGVDSEEGKGSTFWFKVPYQTAKAHQSIGNI